MPLYNNRMLVKFVLFGKNRLFLYLILILRLFDRIFNGMLHERLNFVDFHLAHYGNLCS